MWTVLAWLRAPGRIVALLVIALATAAYLADPFLLREMRLRGFDAMQRLWPQAVQPPQVLIVDVDEASLRQQGQWPWPRALVAKLIDRIAEGKPRVLGIDVLFPEPDRLSPTQLPKFIPDLPASVISALAGLPSSDTKLAAAIANVPTVLGMAPSDEEPAPNPAGPRKVSPMLQKGGAPHPFIVTHRSLVRSLPEISDAARTEASLGTEIDDDGMVRSEPLIALVEEQLVPAFAIEILRIATRSPAVVVSSGSGGVESIAVGDFVIPTDASGRAYLHFKQSQPRYFSATELFDPGFDVSRFNDRIVLFAVTGLGTIDRKNTPLGMMEGVEVHAQLIESILAGSVLQRPSAVVWIELALILGAGLVIVGLLRFQRPYIATGGIICVTLILIGAQAALFRGFGWLVDGFLPAGVALIAFGAMLGGNFIAELREERRLAAILERERELKARLDGELAAARSIQMGLLPHNFPAFPDREEIDLYARIEPARNVGGDLFDFLLIDRTRLFFMIGDVSGKGIPAALFMAMTKEVVRDAAARHGAALDSLLAEANRKIAAASNDMAEEGANLMFVTAFAGLLDVISGELVYASAGHDSPLVIMAGKPLRELATEGGPPLGAIEEFHYPISRSQLEAGAVLVLYTDGVTEAQNDGGALYSARRLTECLAATTATNAREAIDLVFDDVRRFVGAAEPADDITLLAVRRLAVSR